METRTNEQVLSAYYLWQDDLIDIDVFFKALEKIKKTKLVPFASSSGITEGQYNYIKRLQNEGKIPMDQSLDITKNEAQLVIHNALNSQQIKPRETLQVIEEHGSHSNSVLVTDKTADTSDLFKDKTEDY